MQQIYDPDHYRIVFCSSAPIGVPFLQELAQDKRFEIVGVVTQGDKPAGRWLQVSENIIKKEAKKIIENYWLRIEDFIATPSKLNPSKSEEGLQFSKRLADKKPDFLVVIAYGKIIPQAILDIPTIGPINIHGSLLPKYRGASPIQSCLLNDDLETGITIMKMDAGMDTGDMIDKVKFKILPERTSQDIINKMQQVGPKFLVDTLRKFGKRLLGPVKQDDIEATHCSKIEKESWLIDPRTESIQRIYCKYRAFSQRPKIYFEVNGKRVIIEEIVLNKWRSADKTLAERDVPLLQAENHLNHAINNISLKPEGKKAMNRKEFTNGYLK